MKSKNIEAMWLMGNVVLCCISFSFCDTLYSTEGGVIQVVSPPYIAGTYRSKYSWMGKLVSSTEEEFVAEVQGKFSDRLSADKIAVDRSNHTDCSSTANLEGKERDELF
jgi:hypothetical protein